MYEDESSPDLGGEQDVSKRLADLEHDNNVLRGMIAEVQMEHVRLVRDFDDVSRKCSKLIAKVNEFVGRFARVQ
jgi:hypothetical protein